MALILLLSLVVWADDAPSPALLLREGFDAANSPIAARILRNKHVRRAVGGGRKGTDGVRVEYVGSERGSERVVMQFILPTAVTEASLSYDVLFEDDFQFVRGGKLHGLGPADPVVGGEKVEPDGWSARLMFLEQGKLRIYNYHQNLGKKYGEGPTAAKFRFEKNRFYRITHHVRLNDPPSASNGFAHVYVDGERLVENNELRFRAVGGPHTLIRRFLVNT
ncbi:MAG: hypothetical protein N2C14_01740, partial [Planctomycetales bacterium]